MSLQLMFTDSTSKSYDIFLDKEIIEQLIENKENNDLILRFCLKNSTNKEFEIKFTKYGNSYYSDAFTNEENFTLNQIIENIVTEYKDHSTSHKIKKSYSELLLF
jgi:hypothetical protein